MQRRAPFSMLRVRRSLAPVATLAVVAVSAACGWKPGHGALNWRTTEGDTALARAESVYAAAHVTYEPGQLSSVQSAPVVGWTGPDGQPFEVTLRTADQTPAQARRFGTLTMRNSARTRAPNVGQYPCTSCHVGRATKLSDSRIADAHRSTKAEHPQQTGGTCATCHSPDNVELLALKNGERVTLDHAYRVCAQCHFQQVTAWAKGGHGKRLDGWQGRRIVMGCADCHDPHKPALEPRLPFRAPHIERLRSSEHE